MTDRTPKLDALLAHARADEPTPAQLASLTRRLGPLLGPGGGDGGDGGGDRGGGDGHGGGAGGAGGAGASIGAAGKLAIATGGLGVVAAVVAIALSSTPTGAPARRTFNTPIAVMSGDAMARDVPPDARGRDGAAADAAAGDGLPARTAPAAEDVPTTRATNGRPLVDPRRAVGDSLAAEAALLERAQRALAKQPARTLAICDEHARHHPRGALREERERLAIEALVALGRRREARARVAAFDRAFPGSVQSERVHALVDSP